MDKHKIILSILLPALCLSSPLEGTSDYGPDYPCDSYSDPSLYGPDRLPTFRPLIIAHRGASGMFPEHTALAYREAAGKVPTWLSATSPSRRIKSSSACTSLTSA